MKTGASTDAGNITESRFVWALLILSVALYAAWITWHSYDRWGAMFCSLDFDEIDSAIYNTSRGKFMFSNARMTNFFAEHISPVYLPVAAFYMFSDGYWFIFFYQAASAALAAIPLFMLSREMLKSRLAALFIAMAWLVNGKVQAGLLSDYHEWAHESLFIFAAFYCILRKRWGWYAIWGALLLSCKEDAFIILAGLGFCAWVFGKSPKVALWSWVAALLYAVGVFGILYPYLRGHAEYKYASYYKWLGETPADIVINFATKPLETVEKLAANPLRVNTWTRLMGQFAFLPPLSPTCFAMLILPSMELFLSIYPAAYGLNFHYPLLVMPLWTLAAVAGLANLARLAAKSSFRISNRTIVIIPAIYMFVVSLAFSGVEGAMASSGRITPELRKHAALVREALKTNIPANAHVSASDGPYSFLNHNPNAYLYRGDSLGDALPAFYAGKEAPQGYDMFPFTEMKIDYIVFDVKGPYMFRARHMADVDAVSRLPEYQRIFEADGLYIFRRRDSGVTSPSQSQ